jgi:acyl-ACP thioesterase
VNRHVNNVRYLEWAVETLPGAFLETHRCADLSLQFEAETTLGDEVRSIAQIDDAGDEVRVRHQLVHAAEESALARAVTTWTPDE